MKLGRMIKSALITLAAVAVLVVVLAWMSGAFHEKVQPHLVAVEPRRADGRPTDVVHEVLETETTEAVGTLQAERRTAVSPKIMATIAEINVSAGDRVKRGQVLARLDDRDLQSKLAQAKKAVEAAEAQAKQAEVDLGRMRSLYQSRVASRQQFDQAEAQHKVAQAQLNGAREAVREAEVALSYTVIQAPSDGVVVDKQADAGNTAAPGQPILYVYDPTALRLEAPVRESLATKLKVGDAVPVRIDALDLEVPGRIDEIVPQAAAASRSVLVKVAVPKKDNMVEGMFGRLVLPTVARRRFCVPVAAVRAVGQLRFVDVVTTGGAVERRAVQLGDHSEFGRIEALSGLQPGEEVVLYGPPPPPMPLGKNSE